MLRGNCRWTSMFHSCARAFLNAGSFVKPEAVHGLGATTGLGKFPSILVIGMSGFPVAPGQTPLMGMFAGWLPIPVVHGHADPSIVFCAYWLRADTVS